MATDPGKMTLTTVSCGCESAACWQPTDWVSPKTLTCEDHGSVEVVAVDEEPLAWVNGVLTGAGTTFFLQNMGTRAESGA